MAIKLATVGKGGSGKTTIAGSLARILAGEGARVLAIDGDPNPNLSVTLGIPRERADDIASIPPSLMKVEEKADGQRVLRLAMSEQEVLDTYAARAPGEIELIVMGKPPDGNAGSGCMCASHRAVRGLIAEMSGCGEHTVTDMEAGLEHLKRGTARNVDVMLIVTEPYYRSLEAAARTYKLADELEIPHVFAVANKVKTDSDREAIEEFCARHDMPIIGVVPDDQQFVEAEREGQAPIDFGWVSYRALNIYGSILIVVYLVWGLLQAHRYALALLAAIVLFHTIEGVIIAFWTKTVLHLATLLVLGWVVYQHTHPAEAQEIAKYGERKTGKTAKHANQRWVKALAHRESGGRRASAVAVSAPGNLHSRASIELGCAAARRDGPYPA